MNAEANLLRDSVNALLTQSAGSSEADLLTAFRDAGLDMALVAEADGGHGLSLTEASAIAFGWGTHGAGLPVVELLLAPALAHAAGRGDIAATCTIAQERGAKAEAPVFEGWTHALTAQGVQLGLTPAERTRPAGTDVAGQAWAGLDGGGEGQAVDAARLASLRRDAALLTAAQMTGAMRRALALVIDHVNTRKQFGKAIGRFQAVQHLIADAATETLVAEAALKGALTLADAGRVQPIDWLAAKAQAGRAAGIVAARLHQAMGAIGFTEEHDLHRYTKQLWSGRDNWGSDAACEREIGRLARAAGSGGLWPLLADER